MKTQNTFARISTEIMKDKSLSPLHKLILGFLDTYQNKPDGSSTKMVWYNTQENLAEELGVSLKTLTDAIRVLEGKGIIFQPKKGLIDKKAQYKNRKAIILVDENNPLPTEFIKPEVLPRKRKKAAITETLSTQVEEYIQPEEKVTQIEEETIDNSTNETNDKFEALKEVLSKQFPMYSDIEYCLPEALGSNYSSELSKRLTKDILKNKIKSDTIEEYITEYVK